MFWRMVVRNSDENTTVSDEGPWERVAQMAADTYRKLSTGASWSGHERNHLFMGGLDGYQFMRVSGLSGLDDPGDSRAFATLDIDRDGWLDVLLGNVSEPRLRLLRNEFGERASTAGNGFVAVRFIGGNLTPTGSQEWSTRDGLGAKVVLDLGDDAMIHREHRVDDGFKAQNSATMLVGIGASAKVASLYVRWPSGHEQTLRGVAPDTLVTVYEDVSASPNGTAFVSAPYRDAPVAATEASAGRSSGWQTRMFPAEPSGQSLRLPRPAIAAEESTLVLHLGMATWCAACAKEISALKELTQHFESTELALVGVPCDPEDTPEKLDAWAERFSPPYEIVTGITDEQRGDMLAVAEATLFQSDVLPFSVVTNADGDVLLSTWGLPSVSALKRLLWVEEARTP